MFVVDVVVIAFTLGFVALKYLWVLVVLILVVWLALSVWSFDGGF